MTLKRLLTKIFFTTTVLLFSTISIASDKVMVTVKNVTHGTLLTPVLIATHKNPVSIFKLGEPASAAVSAVAEGGDVSGVLGQLKSDGGEVDHVVTDPILPGHSVSVMLNVEDMHYLSLVSMLLPTNDGFIGINSMRLNKKTAKWPLKAYDAGSEENSERCADIPGPHCGGEPFSEGDAEGYIHVHAGIHGIGDLAASERDWNNPVAIVTYHRVNDND